MNFGSGAGPGAAPGEGNAAEAVGVAKVLENAGAAEPGAGAAVEAIGFAASTSVTFAAEVAAKSTAAFLLASLPATAGSCACARHTLPSPRKTNTHNLFMLLPSEG